MKGPAGGYSTADLKIPTNDSKKRFMRQGTSKNFAALAPPSKKGDSSESDFETDDSFLDSERSGRRSSRSGVSRLSIQ